MMMNRSSAGGDPRIAQLAQVIAEIAVTLEKPGDVDERIAHALDVARAILPFDRCGMLHADGTGRVTMVLVPARLIRDSQGLPARLQRLWMLLNGDAEMSGINSAAASIALPIVSGDMPVGMLMIERDDVPYSAEHVQLLSTVASQLGAYLNLLRCGDHVLLTGAPPSHDRPDASLDAVPFRCPRCNAPAGFPFMARTKRGVADLLSLSNRCRECHHEWENDVPTNVPLDFRM